MKKRITACAAALVTAAAFGDVAWTNDLAILTFGWSGAVKSLVERETGRELVKPGSFVFVSVGDRLVYPSKFENSGGDLYRWTFSTNGTLTMKARSFVPRECGLTIRITRQPMTSDSRCCLLVENPSPVIKALAKRLFSGQRTKTIVILLAAPAMSVSGP